MAFKTGLEKEQVVRLPLVGAYTAYQTYTNCILETIPNTFTGAKRFYVTKRPGWTAIGNPGGSNKGTAVKAMSSYSSPVVLSAYGLTNSTVYYYDINTATSSSLGATTGFIRHIEEIAIGSTIYAIMLSSDSTGWYYPMGSGTGATQTFTATTSNGFPELTAIPSTANLYVGMAVSGTGIPAGTRILSVDSGTQVTMTANATATNAGITVTRSSLAKIIDSDFPGNASRTLTGRFVSMNGYLYVMDTEGYIYNSDNGSITSWTALNKILAQSSPDKGVGIIRYKDYIIAFGTESIESYEDVGNESGTPLQRVSNSYFKIGCSNQAAYWELPDGIAWISPSSLNEYSVYVLIGNTPKKISTREISELLSPSGLENETSSNIPQHTITSFLLGSQTLIAVGVHRTNQRSVSYLYSLEENCWVKWDTNFNPCFWDNVSSFSVNKFSGQQNLYGISRNWGTGGLYYLNTTAYVDTDGGVDQYFTMLITTNLFDGETSLRKKLSKLCIVADTTATTPPAGTNLLSITWSDYGVGPSAPTFSVDLTGSLCITGLGSFIRRRFSIRSDSTLKVRLEALELHIKQGSH